MLSKDCSEARTSPRFGESRETGPGSLTNAALCVRVDSARSRVLVDGSDGLWFSGTAYTGEGELYCPMEDLELTGLRYSYGAYIAFAGLTLDRTYICLENDYSAKNAGGQGWITTLGTL